MRRVNASRRAPSEQVIGYTARPATGWAYRPPVVFPVYNHKGFIPRGRRRERRPHLNTRRPAPTRAGAEGVWQGRAHVRAVVMLC
jgi:hypothetical protein